MRKATSDEGLWKGDSKKPRDARSNRQEKNVDGKMFVQT